VTISTTVGSQAEDTMPTSVHGAKRLRARLRRDSWGTFTRRGGGGTTQMLAAQFRQHYTCRVEATALADDAIDWGSLPETREITR